MVGLGAVGVFGFFTQSQPGLLEGFALGSGVGGGGFNLLQIVGMDGLGQTVLGIAGN